MKGIEIDMANEKPQHILEVMLHPVRMQIMLALAGSLGMTSLQISERLAGVPQATLYRHINRLLKAGILLVVDQRPVRGTVEKIYTLNSAVQTRLGNEAVSGLSKEDHLRFFTSFAVTLIDEFSRYLTHSPTVDYAADGVGYHQLVLFMSDEELVDFSLALNKALVPFIQAGEAPERRKRIFTTIFMPEVSGK
jgi:DNA-binding transcriptional ArsR family regulator